jgi:selenocysteine lyase/cysteine desulfurase
MSHTPLEPQDFLEQVRDELRPRVVLSTPFGRRRLVYADYVASGQVLGLIERMLEQRVHPLYANTHSGDSWTGAITTHYVHEAAAYIKRAFGADDRYALLFAGSGATGAIRRWQEILSLTVPSAYRDAVIESLAPSQRPVVFVGPYEHHSNEVSWRETIAEVREVPLASDGSLSLSALDAALADPSVRERPKIGSFSAASNVTGVLTDTRAVARILHRHHALACFDFAAAAPYVAIDVRPGSDDGYDAIYLSPHKFVGGPDTPGILLFRRDLYHLASPTLPGGGTVTFVNAETHRFISDLEAREDGGTPPIIQKLRAALAVWVKEQIGAVRIEALERDVIRRVLDRLGRHPRIAVLGNPELPRLAIVSFTVQARSGLYLHPHLVVRLLNDLFGIQARGGCLCAGPYGHHLMHIGDEQSSRLMAAVQAGYEGVKPGWTRVAFHYTMSEAEIAYLLDAIEFVADFGEQFAQLYHFDWNTGTWSHPDEAALPSLFTSSAAEDEEGPPPYAAYLEEAHRLAASLPPAPPLSGTPTMVPPDLVHFLVN